MKYSLLIVSTCLLLSSCTRRESVPRPAAAGASIPGQQPGSLPTAPAGQDPGFTVEGVGPDRWLLKEMKILVKPEAKGLLTVTATPVNLPKQPTDNGMDVSYEGKALQSCEFTAGVEKNCDVDLALLTGKPNARGLQELLFTSKRQFSPKELGINEEKRALSFRIEKIAIADKPLFVMEGIGADRWLLKEMKVMVSPAAKGVLSLSATPLNLPHQPTDNALTVNYGGVTLQTCEFKAGVEKNCDVDLSHLTGKPNEKGWHELLFTAKRQFVPKDLKVNDETRALSFRIGTIAIADKPLFLMEGVGEDKWLMKEMKILVNPEAKGTLTVTALPLNVKGQPTDNTIEIYYGGKLLQSCDFTAGVQKNCELELSYLSGKPNDKGWHELQYKTKRQFIPKALGINADTRSLSFQVEKISVTAG